MALFHHIFCETNIIYIKSNIELALSQPSASLPAGKFSCFFFVVLALIFSKLTYTKSSFRKPSKCQTVWIPIRPTFETSVGPDLGPKYICILVISRVTLNINRVAMVVYRCLKANSVNTYQTAPTLTAV